MQVKLHPIKEENPTSLYVVNVNTMEGDGDDYHDFDIKTESLEELSEIVIGLSILINAFPDGRGGYDDYCGDFYEKYVSDKIFCSDGMLDSIQSFCVTYFNENGNNFRVEIIIDDEMQLRIDSAEGLTESDIKEMKVPVMTPENKKFLDSAFDEVAEKFESEWNEAYPLSETFTASSTGKSRYRVLAEMYNEFYIKVRARTSFKREYFDTLAESKGFAK